MSTLTKDLWKSYNGKGFAAEFAKVAKYDSDGNPLATKSDICYMVVKATKNNGAYNLNHNYNEISEALNRGYGISLQVEETSGNWEIYELSEYVSGGDIKFYSVKDNYEDEIQGETIIGPKLVTISANNFTIEIEERTSYTTI